MRKGWLEAGPLGPNGLGGSARMGSEAQNLQAPARMGSVLARMGSVWPEWARLPRQAKFFKARILFFDVEEAIF